MVRTSVTHSAIASCATFLFLPHFDVICDLLLNRRTATWNLFVKGKTDQPICPVRAVKTFLSFQGTSTGPLFQYLSGSPLTKVELTCETRQRLSMSGLQPSQYARHSYRIGAATSSASVGLPPWLIKTLGWWSSDCYERYIQCPHSLLSGISCQLLGDMSN